jgi:hypothetical protein
MAGAVKSAEGYETDSEAGKKADADQADAGS